MARNIVLLFDGTSNEICANRTNILRLYGTLTKSDSQIVWYDPGVGTFGAENSWLEISRKANEFWGMATGWGLDGNVKEAYRFLVDTVQTDAVGERDRIYIFGFSRGAYTARVLAGFLHAFGLMEPRNLNLLDYAYRAYKRIGDDGDENAFAEMRLFERIIRPERPVIRLLGLFDTVASVIESGRVLPRLRNHAHVAHNVSVQSVRHAVALDERRTMFRPLLWPRGQHYKANRFDPADGDPQDLREVWFRGVHGDIGGGYPEEESALAKIPLHWMIEETRPLGLLYKTRTVNEIVLGRGKASYVAPDPRADRHESMHALWPILEFIPRHKPKDSRRPAWNGLILPRKEPRHPPQSALIHASVAEGPLPDNLPPDHAFYDFGG
ncbi:T6SS phospholipase effector Tle1-like catalytic domain-containing protein [Sagittula salina]|uniref:DUF2235 domain-containing protein n=1 Tax=Sagittula salina TaxID=2820268 RepID=A0A940MLY1_9RHOB|nr:DUF2235 domain-containing protein [Sagittula salina]MBP0484285.1 DUF2235 domain-containing protein [Sagittula salina]